MNANYPVKIQTVGFDADELQCCYCRQGAKNVSHLQVSEIILTIPMLYDTLVAILPLLTQEKQTMADVRLY